MDATGVGDAQHGVGDLGAALLVVDPEWAARWLPNRLLLADWFLTYFRASLGFQRVIHHPALHTDEELATLTMPVLVVAGGRTVLFDPAELRRRLAALPIRLRFEVLDQAGHAVCGDEPDRCVDLVLGLVTTV